MIEFKRGDKVKKTKGFEYRGTLLGIVEKLDGTPIALVEHELEKGMVHVYQLHQLEIRDE